MWIIVKKIGGADNHININENGTVWELKQAVAEKMDIPPEQQRLMLKGKSLSDESTVRDCGVEEGSKLVLSVRKVAGSAARAAAAAAAAVSKPNLSDELYKFLCRHYSEKDARLIVDEFKKDTYHKIHSLSLDDIERLATANLQRT